MTNPFEPLKQIVAKHGSTDDNEGLVYLLRQEEVAQQINLNIVAVVMYLRDMAMRGDDTAKNLLTAFSKKN